MQKELVISTTPQETKVAILEEDELDGPPLRVRGWDLHQPRDSGGDLDDGQVERRPGRLRLP